MKNKTKEKREKKKSLLLAWTIYDKDLYIAGIPKEGIENVFLIVGTNKFHISLPTYKIPNKEK